jgi:hypothetical protein
VVNWALSSIIRSGLEQFSTAVREEFVKANINTLVAPAVTPRTLMATVARIDDPVTGAVGTLGLLPSLISGLSQVGVAFSYEPLIEAIRIKYRERDRRTLPDPAAVIRYHTMTGRGVSLDPESDAALALQGYSPWAIQALAIAGRSRLTYNDYWRLYRRGALRDQSHYQQLLDQSGLYGDDTELVDRLLEQRLSPDRVLKAWHRQLLSASDAKARLLAEGLRDDDVQLYLDTSDELLPLDVILALLFRERIDPETFGDCAHALGFKPEDVKRLIEASVRLPDRADLDRLLFAGRIKESEYKTHLKHAGYDDQTANLLASWPWQPAPLDLLRRAVHFGVMDPAQAANKAKHGGMNPEDARTFSDVLYDPLPLDALTDLYRREVIDKSKVIEEFKKHGFAAGDATALEGLAWQLPGIGDLIRLAVREAFTPDVIAKFGHDQELPPDAVTWGKKIGLAEEWVKRYWYAHWVLPDATQGYEMLHRTKRASANVPGLENLKLPQKVDTQLSEDDLKLLLKVLDISPFWRDRFVAMSYQPIERVDIRRAYQAGIVDETEVYLTYRDLGYDDRASKIMTAWTHEEYTPRHLDLIRDKVADALERGSMDAKTAKSILTGTCKFRAATADFLIELSLFNRQKALKELSTTVIKDLLEKGAITESEARDRLAALRYGPDEINLILAEWAIKKSGNAATAARKDKKPTLADLRGFLKAGIIDYATFMDEVSGLGYKDEYVYWYTAEILAEGETHAE